MPEATDFPAVDLFRRPGGELLHVAYCLHLDKDNFDRYLLVAPDERGSFTLCSFCSRELSGQGRTYFDSLSEALTAYGAPVVNVPRMREFAAGYDYDRIWIPYSRSYVMLAKGDGNALAVVGKTYVWDTASRTLEPLVGYASGEGSERTSSSERPELVCSSCGLALPAAGQCDYCD